MIPLSDIVGFLKRTAPLDAAEAWDNVGLLLGDDRAPISRVMTCLTATNAVAAEAVADGVQLIVSHHPILFKPTQRITTATAEGVTLLTLVRAGIAVYSAHTAYDNAAGGINDHLCKLLGLRPVGPLRPAAAPQCKLVIFVPDQDLAKVSDALFRAGAGVIGEYRECSYRVSGTGTFFGSDAANPAVGKKGRREEVAEWRLEVVCPETVVGDAVRALRAAHSYEEPAFDIYPLCPSIGKQGAGRIGRLPAKITLSEFAGRVKDALHAASVQVVGDVALPVDTVAVACGAAGEFLKDAEREHASVFLTGEMRFHECLAAQAAGVAVVLPGHYATERPGVEDLAARLAAAFPDLQVWASRRECDPLAVV